MKKALSIIFALVCTSLLFAQGGKFPTVKEIVTIEDEDTGRTVDVVNIPVDGVNHYWLHVGTMGIGDKIVQVELDPVYRLYIPLGNNVTEAVACMEDLKTLFKEPNGTMREVQGSFKPFFPGQDMETIQVYRHKFLLSNQLQFVLERDGYLRVAYLGKSEYNSLLRGLKFHGKLHPSER